MSRVFLAEEVRLGRRVVVKVLPPELAAGVSAERFEREIQLAAKLQHPHIVPLLTAGAQGDLLYYVMPHIAGESLRAPNVDQRADLYAVGALGYELLAGRTPFGGLSPQGMLAAQVTATPDPVTQHRDSVPPALAALIMRCLAKLPADRPQSAEELLGQLEAMATPTGATLSEPSAISSGTQAALRRSHPVRVATLFALAAVGVLALAQLLVRLLGLPDWAFAGAVGLAAAALPFMLWTGAIERRRARAGVPHWLTWRRALVSAGSGFGLLGLVTATHAAMRPLGRGYVVSAELVSAADGAALVSLR